MTQYVPSLTIDNVIDALAGFLRPFVGGVGASIVRGQGNRVPMPATACVVLTELLQVDLSTPNPTDTPVSNLLTETTPTRIDVQIDFYGPDSGDQCKAIKGIFRTEWATMQFADGIKPLYCGDGVQSPLVTGEQQYESRWTLTASLQYNAAVTLPQQYADALATTVTAADLL